MNHIFGYPAKLTANVHGEEVDLSDCLKINYRLGGADGFLDIDEVLDTISKHEQKEICYCSCHVRTRNDSGAQGASVH
jgi:hypothetical protein